MIKFSGFSDEISSDFEEQLVSAKELGLSHISIRGVDKQNIADCSIETVNSHILPLCQKYGISISSIGSPLGKIFIYDSAAFTKELDRTRHIAEIANILSCKYVRIFSFYIPHGQNPDDYLDEVSEKLNQIVDILQQAGLIGILENEKETFCDIPARSLGLVELIGNPNLRLAFDFANFVQCDADPLEAYELLSEYIEYFHIKDAKFGGSNVVCGTGDGRIKEILFDSIVNNHYSGFLTLEPHLALFDSLAQLELRKPEEIIPDSQVESGYQGFKLQLKALKEILNSFQRGS
jgi:sugar phosphate isomerase/epimerase